MIGGGGEDAVGGVVDGDAVHAGFVPVEFELWGQRGG